jgi:hypothetical protein
VSEFWLVVDWGFCGDFRKFWVRIVVKMMVKCGEVVVICWLEVTAKAG